MKNLSIAKRALLILEAKGKPMFLHEIVSSLGDGFDAAYVQPSVTNLVKVGLVKAALKTVPALKGEKTLKIYSVNKGSTNEQQ